MFIRRRRGTLLPLKVNPYELRVLLGRNQTELISDHAEPLNDLTQIEPMIFFSLEYIFVYALNFLTELHNTPGLFLVPYFNL